MREKTTMKIIEKIRFAQSLVAMKYRMFIVRVHKFIEELKTGNKLTISEKGMDELYYLLKVLGDTSYTYETYSEKMCYDIFQEVCRNSGAETEEDRWYVARRMVEVMLPFID